MTSLIYYTPGRFDSIKHLPDMKVFLSLFKVFNHNISFVDRTGTIVPPIRTCTLEQVKLPQANPGFNMSFDECAVSRATDIFKHHQEIQKPIRLSWSGGIDSSAALMGFIEAVGMKQAVESIEISMSAEGITENPYLWEKVIRPNNFKVVNSLLVSNELDDSRILVNGEGGDQVQGVDLYRALIKLLGPTAMVMPWNEELITRFIKFRSPGLTDSEYELLSDRLITLVKAAPIEITSLGDFWWWINFASKWASTFYRLLSRAPAGTTEEFVNNYFFPFYNSKNFQWWSMYKREEKHKGDWDTYKWKAKEFVATTSNCPDYVLKHRQGSLSSVLSHTVRYEAIDNEFNFIDRINPEDWYNPDNSFKA